MEYEEVVEVLQSLGFEYVDSFYDENGYEEVMFVKGDDFTASYYPEMKRLVLDYTGTTRNRKKKLPENCTQQKGGHSIIIHCTERIHVNGISKKELKSKINSFFRKVT